MQHGNLLWQRTLEMLFPARCPSCHSMIDRHGTLCGNCWNAIQFIAEPLCECCGLPFAFPVDAGALCGDCIQETPPYAKARAVFAYDEHTSRLVTALKFHDATHMAPVFAEWMLRGRNTLVEQAEVIIPVPLHRRRLWERKFNQSALLARHIALLAGKPLCVEGLLRARYTPPQTGLTKIQRTDNVRGAFKLNPRHKESLAGTCVLLVDDVMTTGSTLNACSKALLKGGAGTVHVLTLARTL